MATQTKDGTIVLTGANGSLGLEFVRCVLKKYPSYTLLMTVRNVSSADPNTAKLQSLIQNFPEAKTELHALDLASLKDVRTFSDKLNSKVKQGELPKIRALVCNAFAWTLQGPTRFTEDGYELGFQVTHLGHFLLAMRTLGSLDPKDGRVLILGSDAHANPGVAIPSDIETMAKPETGEKSFGFVEGFRRYGMAKLAAIMFTYELRSRLEKDPNLSGVTALAVNPGNLPQSRCFDDTPAMLRIAMNYFFSYAVNVMKYFMKSARTTSDAGAEVAEMAVRPLSELDGKGAYWLGKSQSKSSKASVDEALRKKVWDASIKWTHLTAEDTALSSL